MIRKEQCSLSWDWGPSFPTQVSIYCGCHINMIRKEQCSFSWDWGPSFPTQGSERNSVHLAGTGVHHLPLKVFERNSVHLAGTRVHHFLLKVSGSERNSVHLAGTGVHHLPLKCCDKRCNRGNSQNRDGNEMSAKKVKIGLRTVELVQDSTPGVELIHPSLSGMKNRRVVISFTFASPHQTQLHASISAGQTFYFRVNGRPIFLKGSNWIPADSFQERVTEKKIDELLESASYRQQTFHVDMFSLLQVRASRRILGKIRQAGQTFYFRINGRPIFLKGSNWIPADSFQERVTEKKIYELLESASYVNINSIRICGIGFSQKFVETVETDFGLPQGYLWLPQIYESDYFYQKADELGIMIWQDFMFACAMYPVDQPFLDSVKQEIIHNLYKDVISVIVSKEDTSRPFISSSPSNGAESLLENWVAKMPWSELYGDIHDYRYLDPFFDNSVYRIPRMASEYGLQSYPSYKSLEEVYAPEDLDYWSDMNDYRQHHPMGNIELLAEMIMYLNIDQAVAMKTETEHYRRWQNIIESSGRGNTMGAMYWQLNDIWQAPTWASIEYSGKWKMLHYYAKHFFAPVLISPYLDGDFVDVFLCIDGVPVSEVRHPVTHKLSFHHNLSSQKMFKGMFPDKSRNEAISQVVEMEQLKGTSGTLYIRMYSWDNMAFLHEWKINYTVSTTAESIFRKNVNELMKEAGCIRNKICFLYFHMGDINTGPVAWLPLTVFKDAIGLSKTGIQIATVEPVQKGLVWNVGITTNAIAPFVWLDVEGVRGHFSDNGFLMVTDKKIVTFYAHELTDPNTFTNGLHIL
ncbi:hypothetical protein KUTeg_015235 [Tegillarca granosa]|uniref:Beta-mannosidase Ig-fold domain-containing protein n=1 Tax=Tegillarca granosa TaxID=220873 RepID=A0ABQ9ET54_TEGGR|nr:hypothetical protein KUTeg_015235 [Tegillarca granosa]